MKSKNLIKRGKQFSATPEERADNEREVSISEIYEGKISKNEKLTIDSCILSIKGQNNNANNVITFTFNDNATATFNVNVKHVKVRISTHKQFDDDEINERYKNLTEIDQNWLKYSTNLVIDNTGHKINDIEGININGTEYKGLHYLNKSYCSAIKNMLKIIEDTPKSKFNESKAELSTHFESEMQNKFKGQIFEFITQNLVYGDTDKIIHMDNIKSSNFKNSICRDYVVFIPIEYTPITLGSTSTDNGDVIN